jgi:hypothetical protein
MTLIDRLRRIAQLWADAQGKELSTLGTMVAKDGKFFGRLADGKTCTVAIFERFLIFFRDPASWPAGEIPADAAAELGEIEMLATRGVSDLMTGAPNPEWPLPSAAKQGENIHNPDDAPDNGSLAA